MPNQIRYFYYNTFKIFVFTDFASFETLPSETFILIAIC